MPARKSTEHLGTNNTPAIPSSKPLPSLTTMVLARVAVLVVAIAIGALVYVISVDIPAVPGEPPTNTLHKLLGIAWIESHSSRHTSIKQAATTSPQRTPVPKPDNDSSQASGLSSPVIVPPPPPPAFVREYTVPTDKQPFVASGQPAPLLWRVQTDQPVVFLTMDDGIVKDPRILPFMQEHNLIASLFLANTFIESDYAYFKDFTALGFKIEDHTLHHQLDLNKMSYTAQKTEICGAADIYAAKYGRRPVLYRPPGGSYNLNTQLAAAACGMKAVVIWHAKADGGYMQWQDSDHLLPGDIVLMHFRPKVIEDLTAFMNAVEAAHLKVALLEDWFE